MMKIFVMQVSNSFQDKAKIVDAIYFTKKSKNKMMCAMCVFKNQPLLT